MNTRSHVTKWVSAALVIAFLLIVSACGGSSTTSSGTSDPTPAQSPPSAEEVKWPTKDITFIVPVSPGGGMDASARLLAKYWEEQIGVSVIVENIPGAEYNNGIFEFLKAKPDGHTLILFPGVIANQVLSEVDYDMNEFGWVGRVSASVQVGIVSKNSGITNLEELIQKGVVKGGVTGLSSSQTIGQLLTGKELGFTIEPITHGGASEAILAVVRGDADWTTAPDITVLPYVQDGDVVPIYTATAERLPNFPDVPSLAEIGYPELLPILAFDRIVATSPGTDPAILEKVRESFKKAVETPPFIEEYSKLGDNPKHLDGETIEENVRKALEGIAANKDYLNSFKK